MKKSNRNILIFFAGVLAGMILLFVYRTINDSEDESMTTAKVQAENLLEGIEARDVEDEIELPDSFLASNRAFSFDLFKELAEEENAVYSPIPVYLSLGLLSNGAVDEARREILDTLNVTDLTNEEFNRYYYELMNLLKADGDTTLTISNSIWHDQDFKANIDFLKTNKTYYNADTFKLDFSDSKAPNEMNNWVNASTNGKIKEMVDEIGEDTVMYLFSAIYFDANWEIPFNLEDTYESEFLVEGEILDIEKMTGRFEIEHLITEEEEGIILPYEDGQYSFVALMPNREVTIREYLQNMNQSKLVELYSMIKKDEVDLLLPKFEVSFENQLNDTLGEMGVKQVFDAESNSLSKIGEASGNLYISKMLQKTYIEVNELGTEAASVVSSEIQEMSMPEPKPTIDFNRPFIYSIIENETGLPVFLGIMDYPKK